MAKYCLDCGVFLSYKGVRCKLCNKKDGAFTIRRGPLEDGFCFVPIDCGVGFSSSGYAICCDAHNFIRLRGRTGFSRLEELMDVEKFIDQMFEYCRMCGLPLKIFEPVISESWVRFFKENHSGVDLSKFEVIKCQK